MLRNKLIYLLLAVYSVIFAILYSRYISAVIMIAILGLPFVMLIMLLIMISYVSVEILPPSNMIGKGEDMKVTLCIKNNSIFPITYCKLIISYGTGYAKKMAKERIKFFIDSKSELSVDCHITAEHCGKLTVCCDSVLFYDYLKLFSIRKKVKKQIDIIILPQLYEIEVEFKPNQFNDYADSDHYSKNKSGDDASEVFNIREYQEGDRLQRIHWKLSSKKNQLMIKEFSLPINCSISILADFTFGEKCKKLYSNIDALLETIFSISNYLILSDYIHYIVWYDKDKKQCRRVQITAWEELCIVMEELVCLSNNMDNEVLFEEYLNNFRRKQMADMFYIGVNLTDAILNRMKNFNPCNWHVLYMNKMTENAELPDGKFLKIDIEKVGESLKEGAF